MCVGSTKKDLTMRVYLIYFTFWHHKWNLKWARPLQYDTVTQKLIHVFNYNWERIFAHQRQEFYFIVPFEIISSICGVRMCDWENSSIFFSITRHLRVIWNRNERSFWKMGDVFNVKCRSDENTFCVYLCFNNHTAELRYWKNFCIRVAHII